MFQILDIIIEVSGLLFLFSHSHQRVLVPFASINVPILPNNASYRYLKYEMRFRPFLFLFNNSQQRVLVPFSSRNVPILPNNVLNTINNEILKLQAFSFFLNYSQKRVTAAFSLIIVPVRQQANCCTNLSKYESMYASSHTLMSHANLLTVFKQVMCVGIHN